MTPDRSLERELRELRLQWPATPDLGTAVIAQLPAVPDPPARRRPWRRPAIAWRPALSYGLAVLIGALAVVMAASPSARSDILEFLGLKSAKIERKEPTAEPRQAAPLGKDLRLGEAMTLGRVRQEVQFPVRVPGDLGDPDAVYLGVFAHGIDVVHLLYGSVPGIPAARETGASLLISQFPARFGEFIQKALGAAASATKLDVDGDPGYFLEGAHGFGFALREGNDGGFEEQRLAGNTLLVERAGMLFRIEGDVSRERALEIFRSLTRP